jgi:hypothetical protein
MPVSVQTLLLGGLSTGIAEYSSTAPTNPANGQLWYNTADNNMYVWTTGVWTLIADSDINTNLQGGIANQILVKKSATDYDFEWEDMIINFPPDNLTKLLDQVSDTLLYLGEAAPDSLESAPVWRISRIIFDAAGNVEEQRYANGGLFNQIWNDRASLIYI